MVENRSIKREQHACLLQVSMLFLLLIAVMSTNRAFDFLYEHYMNWFEQARLKQHG